MYAIRSYYDSREQYLQKCPPGNQLVAEINGAIGGYVGFDYPTPLSSNRHVLDINIAVHPDYRITSYNVCYTKLLRIKGKFTKIPHHQIVHCKTILVREYHHLSL